MPAKKGENNYIDTSFRIVADILKKEEVTDCNQWEKPCLTAQWFMDAINILNSNPEKAKEYFNKYNFLPKKFLNVACFFLIGSDYEDVFYSNFIAYYTKEMVNISTKKILNDDSLFEEAESMDKFEATDFFSFIKELDAEDISLLLDHLHTNSNWEVESKLKECISNNDSFEFARTLHESNTDFQKIANIAAIIYSKVFLKKNFYTFTDKKKFNEINQTDIIHSIDNTISEETLPIPQEFCFFLYNIRRFISQDNDLEIEMERTDFWEAYMSMRYFYMLSLLWHKKLHILSVDTESVSKIENMIWSDLHIKHIVDIITIKNVGAIFEEENKSIINFYNNFISVPINVPANISDETEHYEQKEIIVPDDIFNQRPTEDKSEYIGKRPDEGPDRARKLNDLINFLAERGYIDNTTETKSSLAYRFTGRNKPQKLVKVISWEVNNNSLVYIIKKLYPGVYGMYKRTKTFFETSDNFQQIPKGQESGNAERSVDATLKKKIDELFPPEKRVGNIKSKS